MGCGASIFRETVAEVPAAMGGITLRAIQIKVKKSAELLDKEVPGWHQHINLNTLNTQLHSACVVGQLNKNLPDHPIVKAMDAEDTSRAFHLDLYEQIIDAGKVVVPPGVSKHDVLTRLWRRQISVRQNKVKKLRKQFKQINKELAALGV